MSGACFSFHRRKCALIDAVFCRDVTNCSVGIYAGRIEQWFIQHIDGNTDFVVFSIKSKQKTILKCVNCHVNLLQTAGFSKCDLKVRILLQQFDGCPSTFQRNFATVWWFLRFMRMIKCWNEKRTLCKGYLYLLRKII